MMLNAPAHGICVTLDERKLARGVPGTFRSSGPAIRDPISSPSHCGVCGPHFPESVCDNNAERSSHWNVTFKLAVFCQLTWPKSASNCLLD